MSEEDPADPSSTPTRISTTDLSSEALFALTFLQALALRMTKDELNDFNWRFEKLAGVPFGDANRARAIWKPLFDKGLDELVAFRIVEVKGRDGVGDWLIDKIHDQWCRCGCESRIIAGGGLVTMH